MHFALINKTLAAATIALLLSGVVAYILNAQETTLQKTEDTTTKADSPLKSARPMAFVPTARPEDAKKFYSETLGLELLTDDKFALIYKLAGDQTLRVQRVKELKPHPFTAFGWQVSDIKAATKELVNRGVKLEKFGFPMQDSTGICTFDNGDRVAWFKDPDGNTLSISQLAQ